MDRKELAVRFHDTGDNCAQSVVLAFEDVWGDRHDRNTVFRLMEPFGAGLGSRHGTCGAISGMAAVLGMLNADGDPEHPYTKAHCYELIAEASRRFEEVVTDTICERIKEAEDRPALYPCQGCIELAVEILESMI